MSVWSLLIVDGVDVVAPAFHDSKDGFRDLPVFLKHVPSLMVGEHGGHCFLVGASGLSQVLSVRIGPDSDAILFFDSIKIERIFQNRLAVASRRTVHG